MKASEHLANILSPYAREVFDVLGLERDERLLGTPDELRAQLVARGWPVYEAAFDFDAAVGGITLGRTSPLGVFAALDRRARARVPRDDELLRFEGKALLPADGAEITGLWIDEQGVVYHGYFADYAGDDDGEYVAPGYASYVTLLERYALQTETQWSRDAALAAARPRYTASIEARLGAALAGALQFPTWPPATDRFARVWRSGERLVIERPEVDTEWSTTEGRWDRLDEVVAFWDVAARLAPGAPMSWAGPAPEPPGPGDPVLRRYTLNVAGRGPREVTVCAKAGQLRIAGWSSSP